MSHMYSEFIVDYGYNCPLLYQLLALQLKYKGYAPPPFFPNILTLDNQL